MTSFLTALILMVTFASTPQAATLLAVSHEPGTKPVVVRTNIVGRYAMVLTHGGKMESLAVTQPVLLEHFAFGWQPLELLDSRCDSSLGDAIDARLLQGMPPLPDDRPCRGGFDVDRGPVADIEAVRKLMRGAFVPYVRVSGNWALGDWYGGGGGQSLYHRRGTNWQRVTVGGGANGVDELHRYGVPMSAMCALAVYDAHCLK